MGSKCPLCGSETKELPDIVLDYNKVYVKGRKYELTPSMINMLTILNRSYPAAASIDEIASGIWGNTESGPPDTYQTIITHYARTIRLVLQDHIKVVGEWGRGYRLEWVGD